MSGDFPVLYLLALVVMAYIIIRILTSAQKTATEELTRVLVEEKNPEKYLSMLNSKQLSLVFRKGTLALMRLDGLILCDNTVEIENTIKLLDRLTLRPSEKLAYYQKRLSYYVAAEDKTQAYATLDLLTALLEKEQSARLQRVLQDATFLVKTQF